MKKSLALLLAFTFPFLTCSCTHVKETPGEVERSAVSNGSLVSTMVEEMAKKQNGNFVVSPVSLELCLYLATMGACGDTQEKIIHGLGYSSMEEYTSHATFLKPFSYGEDSLLSILNSVFHNTDSLGTFLESYLTKLQEFGGTYYEYDTEHIVPAINELVEKETHGLIEQLLDPSRSDIANVLLNVLYLKNAFCHPFLEERTQEKPFYLLNGEGTTNKDYMCKTEKVLYYNRDVEYIEIPMQHEMSLFIGKGIGNLNYLGQSEQGKYVDVYMEIPKIDIETTLSPDDFTNIFQSLNMGDVLLKSANFENMMTIPFSIDELVQKNHIKWDESGVEAAAATAIINKATSVKPDSKEPIKFIVDSAFTFAIVYEGKVLFCGQVTE